MDVTKHIDTSAHLWSNRATREHKVSANYESELRTWVHRAILEAERNRDVHKKAQLLGLLSDLQTTKNRHYEGERAK